MIDRDLPRDMAEDAMNTKRHRQDQCLYSEGKKTEREKRKKKKKERQ
jgi:hypothetical protein